MSTDAGKRLLAAVYDEPDHPTIRTAPWLRLVAAIEAEAVAAALTALRAKVVAIPNTSGAHLDTAWNDVIGATQSWHECHGLDRAAVLAAIDEAMLKP